MSKAMLIIDMPKKCGDCPLYRIEAGNELCAPKITTTSIEGKLVVAYKKPDWCPLKEVPEKQENLPANIYRDGWNACIDKILKGSEENGKNNRC